jgi:aspartate racemase
MSKRIGILGGISAESTVRYYDRIIKGYFERRRDYYYPEVVIFSLNLQRFTDFEDRGDREGYLAEIMSGVRALERAGAEFVVMAANSPHAVFDEVEGLAKVPLLSIVRVTAEHAARMGLRRLLLLGIKFTMQSSFYQEGCREYGIEIAVPAGEDQDRVNRIIFEELTRGVVRDGSREELLGIIKAHPADGVILGCTELPLILRPGDSPMPLLDTLELHAAAALDFSLSS